MDADVANAIQAGIASGVAQQTKMAEIANQNLTQGLGTIQNLCLQAAATVSDDPALFGTLNTASRVPASGALTRG